MASAAILRAEIAANIAAPVHWDSFRLWVGGAAVEIIRKLAELLQRRFWVGNNLLCNQVRFRRLVYGAIP